MPLEVGRDGVGVGAVPGLVDPVVEEQDRVALRVAAGVERDRVGLARRVPPVPGHLEPVDVALIRPELDVHPERAGREQLAGLQGLEPGAGRRGGRDVRVDDGDARTAGTPANMKIHRSN